MTATIALDDDDLETILTIARNNQAGRIAQHEIEALVAAYRTQAAKDRRLSVEINRALGKGGPVAEVAAVLSERVSCAQIANAEGDQRLAYAQAARNGSREWGDPEAAAMAQGHKAVTAHGIARAIMGRGDDFPADDGLARRANDLRGDGPFPLRSTPAMRVRARELAMPNECDFDRAVIDIIDDLDAMIVAAARFTPAPVVLGEALQKLYNDAEAEQAKFFEERKFDLAETRRQRCLGISSAIDVVEQTLAAIQTPASVAVSVRTIAQEIANFCFISGIEVTSDEISGLAKEIAKRIAVPPADDWRDIASAPKDGSPVWLGRVGDDTVIGSGWVLCDDSHGGGKFAWVFAFDGWQPTHWMPRQAPMPPKGGRQ